MLSVTPTLNITFTPMIQCNQTEKQLFTKLKQEIIF